MRNAESGGADRSPGALVSLRQLSLEWSTSRQTVRRVLERAGIRPVILNDSRNGTRRYSRDDVGRFIEKCRMHA